MTEKTSCKAYNEGKCEMECSACSVFGYERGTDADFDRYAEQVQNGVGYYDAAGQFHYYPTED